MGLCGRSTAGFIALGCRSVSVTDVLWPGRCLRAALQETGTFTGKKLILGCEFWQTRGEIILDSFDLSLVVGTRPSLLETRCKREFFALRLLVQATSLLSSLPRLLSAELPAARQRPPPAGQGSEGRATGAEHRRFPGDLPGGSHLRDVQQVAQALYLISSIQKMVLIIDSALRFITFHWIFNIH